MLDEPCAMRRARKEPSEPLGARAVEAAFAKGSVARNRLQDRASSAAMRLARKERWDDAPALLEQDCSVQSSCGRASGARSLHLSICPLRPPAAIAGRRLDGRSQMPFAARSAGVCASISIASAPSIPQSRRARKAERPAVPAEGEDLLEPDIFGNAGIGADAALERIASERAHQPVAGSPALAAILPARQGRSA